MNIIANNIIIFFSFFYLDFGDEAEQILGASVRNGELELLMKWKRRGRTTLVNAKITNIQCPQLVSSNSMKPACVIQIHQNNYPHS